MISTITIVFCLACVCMYTHDIHSCQSEHACIELHYVFNMPIATLPINRHMCEDTDYTLDCIMLVPILPTECVRYLRKTNNATYCDIILCS